MNFLENLAYVNDIVNDLVWAKIGIILLLFTGLLMTILTKCFQLTHVGHWFKKTIGSIFDKKVIGHTKEKASISQFQALCTALAATVGVGNIAGVASAIASGGPGAIFWMWVAAFLGMMTNYSENILGIYYRRKNKEGEWSGGAMYYLQDGLGNYKGMKQVGKVLAILFASFAVLASFGIGNMGQVNKIVANITSAFDIKALSSRVLYSDITLYNLVIGIVIMVLIGIVVMGGLKRIAAVAETIVPFMIIVFFIGALIIIGINWMNIGPAFKAIFSSAFTGKAVWGGTVGVTVLTVVTYGCKRGVFSNEAGLGSSVMVHSNSNVREPVKQGLWGIFEVFADTIVVCTLTALVVLTSGVIDLETGVLANPDGTDATLVADAFDKFFYIGDFRFGKMFVALAILVFAFTTILGWSHYGSKAVEYLSGDLSKVFTTIYKCVFVLVLICGAMMTSSIAWDISDTFNGLMMIPNLIGVLALSPVIIKLTNNYVDRKIKGKKVKPMLSFFEDINEENARVIEETGED